MANDTAISRAATESTTAVHRRKVNNESIDIGKLSFFDELLNMGQFESTFPAPTDLPSQSSHSVSQSPDDKESSSTDKSDSPDKDTSPGQWLSQPPLVAQPIIAVEKNVSTDDSISEQERHQDNSIQGGQDPKARVRQDSSPSQAESDNAVELAKQVEYGAQAPDTPVQSPTNAQAPDAQVNPEGEESNGLLQPNASDKRNAINPIQQSNGSANKTDAESVNADLEKDPLSMSNAQGTTKDEGKIPVSRLIQEESGAKDYEAIETLPRNKRAERLAQRATSSEQSSNDISDTNDSKEANDANDANSQLDSKSDSISRDGSFSNETISVSSTSNASTPIANIPPIVAASFTLSGSITNPSVGPHSAVDSSTAKATSAIRGGMSFSNANTSLPGNATTPARADQSRAEVVRSGAGTQITAYQEAKLVQRVLRGVEQLANGGGQVRLRLHPPELGSLQMSLRMEAGQVFARLEVENSTAKDALLNNVQTLKDRMAEQGMKVAAFEVEVSTDASGSGTGNSNLQSDRGSGGDSRWDASSRFAQQNNNRVSSEPALPEQKSGATWIRTNGSLDLTV